MMKFSGYEIRDLEFFDLPKMSLRPLKTQFFHTARRLSWGRTMMPMSAFLTPVPHVQARITKLVEGDCLAVGQLTKDSWESFARLNYLSAEKDVCSLAGSMVLDGLVEDLINMNVHAVFAETEINVPSYEFLKRHGFSTIGYQKVWRVPMHMEESNEMHWLASTEADQNDFLNLYKEVTPPVIRNAERPEKEFMYGMVYEEKGEKVGFAEIMQGPVGVSVRLLMHPKIEEIEECLLQLAHVAHRFYTRAIYFIVPAYMSWLDSTLLRMNADVSDLMAVMTKSVVVRRKVAVNNQAFANYQVAMPGTNRMSTPITIKIIPKLHGKEHDKEN